MRSGVTQYAFGFVALRVAFFGVAFFTGGGVDFLAITLVRSWILEAASRS